MEAAAQTWVLVAAVAAGKTREGERAAWGRREALAPRRLSGTSGALQQPRIWSGKTEESDSDSESGCMNRKSIKIHKFLVSLPDRNEKSLSSTFCACSTLTKVCAIYISPM